jgi:hypothetical protein
MRRRNAERENLENSVIFSEKSPRFTHQIRYAMQTTMKINKIHISNGKPMKARKAERSERETMLNPTDTEKSSTGLRSLNLKNKTQHNPGKNIDRSVKTRDNKRFRLQG